jgi:succinoglycan biosynthesis protein ExoA
VPAWPHVSVLLPVLNEAPSIDACLASLLAQDYPGALEVVVAEGGSTDGTDERLRAAASRHPGRLRIVDNHRRLQAHGLNLAADCAKGEILVRADAHTIYAPDYTRRSVEALQDLAAAERGPGSDAQADLAARPPVGEGADSAGGGAGPQRWVPLAVGGRLRPVAGAPGQEAVAAAMRSPLAIGPGRFHHAERREEVDTVYLGAWRRADFLALGGFRALPSGAAEDADFYWRLRAAGGRVVLDPAIQSAYHPRGTIRALARQNWRYGVAKAEMLWLNGQLPSWRPLAPLALVTALAAAGLLAATGRSRWPLGLVTGSWSGLLAAVAQPSAHPTRTAAATAAMHLAYGTGLTRGLLRGPAPIRHLRGGCGTSRSDAGG